MKSNTFTTKNRSLFDATVQRVWPSSRPNPRPAFFSRTSGGIQELKPSSNCCLGWVPPCWDRAAMYHFLPAHKCQRNSHCQIFSPLAPALCQSCRASWLQAEKKWPQLPKRLNSGKGLAGISLANVMIMVTSSNMRIILS